VEGRKRERRRERKRERQKDEERERVWHKRKPSVGRRKNRQRLELKRKK
jgi:hypothetical protein